MPRLARIVIPNVPHHITQRGNNRQDIFFVDDDRRVYLDLLKEQTERFGVSVLGFCLMTNHVHLVATPRTRDGLAKALGRTHFRYTQYINRFHRRSGHLWQERFFSCALDEEHTVAAMRYVERNPVRARIVRKPWRYAWSSAAAHVGAKDKSGLLDLDAWRHHRRPKAWRKMLERPLEEEVVTLMRNHTMRGRPLGSDSFLSKLERRLRRRLRALPVGRPRKKHKK